MLSNELFKELLPYPNVEKVPSKIDLAVIATPAHTIPQIIEECGKAGVKGAIIISAGLSENDETGRVLARQILEYARLYGVRIIGPSSLGVIRPKNNLYATFGDKKAIPGKIAFISQSAALCGSVLDWSSETKVGLSAVVSIGSMIDVDLGELVEHFGTDPQTRAMMVYVENIKDFRSFISASRGFARTKPIIIVRGGRFDESRDYSSSKISQLSEDDIYDAVFRRVGIVRVDTISELFDCAKSLSMQPSPCSPNLTIITNASGPGLLAADQLHLKGGKLSHLNNASKDELKKILPYYCSASNPIDILEEAKPDRFKSVMEFCLKDEQTDGSVLVIYSPQGLTDPSSIAEMTIDLAKQTKKTLLIALMGEDNSCQEARRMLHHNNIPSFRTPEEAISTFLNMFNYSRNIELLYQTPEEVPLLLDNSTCLEEKLRFAFSEGRQVLSLPETLSFLKAYKILAVETRIASSIDEALVHDSEIGFPITMRPLYVQSTLRHERDELILNVFSLSEVPAAFYQIVNKIEPSRSSEFQGVIIQPKMQSGAKKLFLGLRKNNKFGPIIIFGTPGDEPEIINNISVGFPPP